MQKLLSILNPTSFFPHIAGEAKKKSAPINRRVVVQSRLAVTNGRARTTGFALSGNTVFYGSIALAVINFALFGTYLFSVNAEANTGYAIKVVEKRIAEKTAENKKLLVQVSEANSIAAVQNSVSENKFVPITAHDSLYVQVNQLSQK